MRTHVPQFSNSLFSRLVLPFTLSLFLAMGIVSCSDDDSDSDGNGSNGPDGTDKALVISSGAQSLSPGGSHQYEARFVGTDGTSEAASNVEWKVDQQFGTISGSGLLNVTATSGANFVTATVTEGNQTYTAKAPVRINISSALVVAPWAIVGQTGDTYQLEAFQPSLNASNLSFAYASANGDVASVDSDGLVTLNGVGETQITVTSDNIEATVPVLVLGQPSAPLPVTRVTVSPNERLYRGQTLQMNAQAFNAEEQEVQADFTWTSGDPTIARVDANGLVTAENIGSVAIRATAQGIIGEAYLEVFPDTVVIIDPIYVSVSPGGSQAFTAKVYNARTETEITQHAALTWELPSFPAPADVLNIGTVSASGNLNTTASLQVNDNAVAGISAPLLAYVGDNRNTTGAANVMVAVTDPNQDCGPGNADVSTINITNDSQVDLSFFGGSSQHQIEFEALDDEGNPVDNPAVKFTSDNLTVADVDDTGLVTATGNGQATITVCSGNFASTTVTVNVQ